MVEKRKKVNKISKTASILRDEFSESHLKDGDRVASAKQIAERFGLSVPTAHEAIKLLVSEGLLYRVRGSGTFIRRGNVHKNYRIALFDTPPAHVPESLHNVFSEAIDNMIESLHSHGCITQLMPYYELRDKNTALAMMQNFDGMLISNRYVDPNTLPLFQASGIPFVVFGHFYEMPHHCSQVFGDMRYGMKEALAMIPSLESREIVIFAENTITSEILSQQWSLCAQEAGIAAKNIETIVIDLKKRSQECYKQIRVYCKSIARKVILTTTDGLAYNIIGAFTLEDHVPGKDFVLISCGNREGQGFRFADEPIISSIDVPQDRMIHESVRLLLQLIQTPSDVIYQARIPSQLVIRKSFHN